MKAYDDYHIPEPYYANLRYRAHRYRAHRYRVHRYRAHRYRASRYRASRYLALVGCTGRGLPLLQHTPAIAALLVTLCAPTRKNATLNCGKTQSRS